MNCDVRSADSLQPLPEAAVTSSPVGKVESTASLVAHFGDDTNGNAAATPADGIFSAIIAAGIDSGSPVDYPPLIAMDMDDMCFGSPKDDGPAEPPSRDVAGSPVAVHATRRQGRFKATKTAYALSGTT